MSQTETYDVAIVGGGPGGYVAAARAAQHGLRTVLIEDGNLGGTCLNVGCIPSKALIHVAEAGGQVADLELPWRKGIVETLRSGVGGLLGRAGVEVIDGRANFRDGKTISVIPTNGSQRTIRTSNLVIATGSSPAALPNVPFGGSVLASDQAVGLDSAPASLLVVGGGYIGVELGTAYAKLGSAVTIIEAEARILSQFDPILTAPVQRRLGELGVTARVNARVQSLDDQGRVVIEEAGGTSSIEAETVLVAIGRRARSTEDGLDSLDLAMDGRFIKIDDRCQTSMTGVYAVGDVTGEPMLAHRAMAQGTLVGDVLAGRKRRWDGRVIPSVCFTDPEIMSVGLGTNELESMSIRPVVGSFPMAANGRARTLNQTDGLVQVVATTDHLVVGIHAAGARVSELAGEAALALEMGATLEDLAITVRAHPTLSESIQEAAAAALRS